MNANRSRGLGSTSRAVASRVSGNLKRISAGERLVRRNPLFFPLAVNYFDRVEAASLDERIQLTEQRLRAVLKAAESGSRYGRSVRAGGELRNWPLLDKESVRDDPDAFVARGRHRSIPASTSGTTGTPLRLLRTLRSVAVEQAALDRLARVREIDLARARIVVLRADDVGRPGSGAPPWRDDLGGRRRIFGSNDLSPRTLDAFADAIETFDPECLFAYPTALESLCRLLERRGRELVVPLTLTSSEVLSTAARRLAERTLRTHVLDYYGQAERVSFAYSFTEEVYTFLPGYGVTELVPLTKDDETKTFEIVGTSLWNLAMPLIRYRTGDLVTLPRRLPSGFLEEVCYGSRPVAGIAGRDDDFLVNPDGGRLVGINHVPRDVENVLRLQIVQETREFVRVMVLPKADFGEPDRRRIAANIERKLPASMRYEIEVVEALEQSSRGKTPLVVRRPGV